MHLDGDGREETGIQGSQNPVHIPAGAIITGIKYHPAGTITNGSNLKNGTVNLYAGTVAIGTNDRKASEAFLGGSVLTQAPVAASGGVIAAGGQLVVSIASSDSARTGVAFDADVYVEYLYADGRDKA